MPDQTQAPAVRPMSPEDIEAILDIDRSISGVERALTYSEMIDGFIGGQIGCSFVAEVDDRVVGFILAAVQYVPDRVSEICLVQVIGVDPEHRRRGVGSALVKALIDHCRSKGLSTIRTMVEEHDRELQGLFEALDFRRGHLIDYSLNL